MKKLVAIVLACLVLVPILAGSAEAWRGGYRGGYYGGWRGGCCWGGWGGFAVGVGIGALATAPYWYGPAYAYPAYGYPAYGYPAYGYPAYSYPAYGYPAYSYPAYSYPTYPPPSAPPADPGAMTQPGTSTSVTYGAQPANPAPVEGAAPTAPTGGQNCQTVTVEGHNEVRTPQGGQSLTTWVPTHTRQVCQ